VISPGTTIILQDFYADQAFLKKIVVSLFDMPYVYKKEAIEVFSPKREEDSCHE
jgi:hypothetical protein